MAPTHVEAETSPLEDPQVDRRKKSSGLDALHAIKIRTENKEMLFGGAGVASQIRAGRVKNLKRAGIANHAVLPLFPRSLPFHPSTIDKMTVIETVKSAVGLSETSATRQEMSEARLPMQYRDSCAHLLIPLNRCRQAEYYLPWKCENERHSYEKCQYEEFKKRVAKMDELRAAKDGARSN
ncbi:hypothetical protein PDIDSM_2204 [Penicillium digitatum]|nr:hypothetical protein PDIDSM_2204 [Penicillium digitatum]